MDLGQPFTSSEVRDWTALCELTISNEARGLEGLVNPNTLSEARDESGLYFL